MYKFQTLRGRIYIFVLATDVIKKSTSKFPLIFEKCWGAMETDFLQCIGKEKWCDETVIVNGIRSSRTGQWDVEHILCLSQ